MAKADKITVPRLDNFFDNFQKDHSELDSLITSFRKAVETPDRVKAKGILSRINEITEGHFSFEETYFYPRLRRLVSEITENLRREQETVRDFMTKSKSFLGRNKSKESELSSLLDMLPRLSMFLKQCNDLIPLARKFNQYDKEDLNKRFKEYRKIKT